MTRKTTSLFAAELMRPGVGAAFPKLHPRAMVKNPVMFVTSKSSPATIRIVMTYAEADIAEVEFFYVGQVAVQRAAAAAKRQVTG